MLRRVFRSGLLHSCRSQKESPLTFRPSQGFGFRWLQVHHLGYVGSALLPSAAQQGGSRENRRCRLRPKNTISPAGTLKIPVDTSKRAKCFHHVSCLRWFVGGFCPSVGGEKPLAPPVFVEQHDLRLQKLHKLMAMAWVCPIT